MSPLTRARKARTLNQEQLAQIAGISQQSLSKAERGTLCLSADVQELIATILGVPRHDLFPEPEQAVAS